MPEILLNLIDPNPFRDFELYPLDNETVEKLILSIQQTGFWNNIQLRPSPVAAGRYQLAFGHHRLAAAFREGTTHAMLHPRELTDDQMLAMMTAENLARTQDSSAAILDVVAANCRKLIYQAFWQQLGGISTKNFVEYDSSDRITEHGPGYKLIYRAINGTEFSERADTEILGEAKITQALSQLKESGRMQLMLLDIREQVTAEIAEVRHKAEEEERARREAEAAAEAQRRWEEGEAERRRLAAIEAERVRKLTEEQRRKEAEERARQKAEAQKIAEAAEAERRRIAAIQEAERKRLAEEEEARKRAERKRIEEAAKYDIRCVSLFRVPAHEAAWRKSILHEYNSRLFPKANQYDLAQRMIAELGDLTSSSIGNWVSNYVAKRDEEGAQRAEEERVTRQIRIDKESAAKQALSLAIELEALETKMLHWQYNFEFPPDTPAQVEVYRRLANTIERLIP